MKMTYRLRVVSMLCCALLCALGLFGFMSLAPSSTAHAQAVQPAQALACPATISEGSTGNTVKLLQRDLDSRVNPPPAVDGIFGPKTDAAVRIWQSFKNLTIDGIVGPQTWHSLGEC